VINFDGMINKFYELMDMDPVKGIPGKKKLEEYGMGVEAERVWQET